MVRRPDSPINSNQLNYKKLINNTLLTYTRLYTQLFSFKNQRYNNQKISAKRWSDDPGTVIPSVYILVYPR